MERSLFHLGKEDSDLRAKVGFTETAHRARLLIKETEKCKWCHESEYPRDLTY